MGARTSSADPRRAALRAFGVALPGAIVWILLAGPLGVTVGLIVVAAFLGWLIGSSSRGSGQARWIAVAAAITAWLLALVGVYLYSLAAIPALPGAGPDGTDLAQRIGETPILTFYAQSFGILDAFEGAVLVVTAWWSAR
jgi:hypothetical protein